METKFFRVDGLPSCQHTDETRKAFKHWFVNDKSITRFVSSAIIEYAINLGFVSENGAKPDYVSDSRYQFIEGKIAKSRGKDYTYLVAFEWLLWKHPGASKSFVQRQAVINFNSS